jgi:hypothetical protein
MYRSYMSYQWLIILIILEYISVIDCYLTTYTWCHGALVAQPVTLRVRGQFIKDLSLARLFGGVI